MSSSPFRQRLALQLLSKRNQIRSVGAQGFTLIELLVVIVILGVLGAVGYQAYLNQIGRANAATAANTATALAKNCSALRVTSEEASFVSSAEQTVDANQVDITVACRGVGNEDNMVVQVGTGGNVRTATAIVRSDGRVTPASLPTS